MSDFTFLAQDDKITKEEAEDMKKLMAFICVVCILSSLLAGCNSDDESVANAEVVDLLWYVPGDAQPDQKAVMKEVNKISLV